MKSVHMFMLSSNACILLQSDLFFSEFLSNCILLFLHVPSNTLFMYKDNEPLSSSRNHEAFLEDPF
jgi:hypothetical protein